MLVNSYSELPNNGRYSREWSLKRFPCCRASDIDDDDEASIIVCHSTPPGDRRQIDSISSQIIKTCRVC